MNDIFDYINSGWFNLLDIFLILGFGYLAKKNPLLILRLAGKETKDKSKMEYLKKKINYIGNIFLIIFFGQVVFRILVYFKISFVFN